MVPAETRRTRDGLSRGSPGAVYGGLYKEVLQVKTLLSGFWQVLELLARTGAALPFL